MAQNTDKILSGVAETLLVTLYLRAMESERPDALIRDEKAVDLVTRITEDDLYDFKRIKLLRLSEASKLVIILRNRQFDRYTLDFLKRTRRRLQSILGVALIRATSGLHLMKDRLSGLTWIFQRSSRYVGSCLAKRVNTII